LVKKQQKEMRFEFEYDPQTDQITIVYDGSFILTVDFDGETYHFKNFEKVDDENIEKMLKTLCVSAYGVLA
jgi:outer membrane lipoprotein-sorting protein